MGNIKKIIISCFAIAAFSLFVFTPENIKAVDVDKSVIGLHKFVKDVCKNDLTFQEILIDNLQLKYLKDLDLASGDIVLSVKSLYNVSLDDSDNNGHESTVSLSKLFPDTGTEISGSLNTSPGYAGSRITTFSAMISQPIAQNAFGYMNRLDERILDLEIDLARHQIIEAYEDYFASLIALYYQWYSDYSNLKTAELALEENTKLLNNIKARKKLNVAYQSDVDKIQLQVIEKQDNLITLEGSYDNTLELICQAGGYKKEKKYIPELTAYYSRDIRFENEFSIFVTSGRTYKMLSLMEQKGSVEVKRNANALLPSVNLLFGYTREKSSSPLIETEDTVYAGVSLDFPFWQQKNNAAYNISKIEEKKTSLNVENTKLQLKTDLKNIYSQIKLEEKLIQSADQKIKLGERVVRSEKKDYQLARIQLRDLITSINNLESYKNNKVYHTAKLHTLIIEWLRLLDKLVSKEDTGIK